MKKYLLLLVLAVFLTVSSTYASHIIGYDMCLINIKSANGQPTNNYKIRVKFFRDIGGVDIPGDFDFRIYRNSDNQQVLAGIPAQPLVINTPKINPDNSRLEYEDGDCAPKGFSGQKIELGIYESAPVDLSILTHPSGYYISATIGARNKGIINVEGTPFNSDQYDLTMFMEVPPLNNSSIYRFNSSPEFTKNPLTYFCINKPYTINWLTEDPDGDSLVFSMSQPLDGLNPAVKPFLPIPYQPGYNLYYNVADGAPDINIDAKTGVINFIPTKAGKFLVAFKCEEYRDGVKIGEIRREFQMETVQCEDVPPVTTDQLSRQFTITDTIFKGDPNFLLTFTSRDSPNDSLTMEYVPRGGDNLIGQGAFFSNPGNTNYNFNITDVGAVQGVFKWVPGCEDVREKPYKFDVVVHDRTCPSPFYDTTYVTLYIKSYPNFSPYFVSPDTLPDQHVLSYFVQAGDALKLNGNDILKAIDTNRFAQDVTIMDVPDPDDLSDFRNQYIFNTNPGDRVATATFEWTPGCDMIRNEPYKIKFIAFDADCFPDTTTLNAEIYVAPALNEPPVMEIVNSTRPFIDDSVSIGEAQLLKFTVKAYDTIAYINNKFREVTVGVFNNDFSDFNVPGGDTLHFIQQTAPDSVSTEFRWTPNCANVRPEPYSLRLFAYDKGCPDSLFAFREIKIKVLGPVNTAPFFPKTVNLIQAIVQAGETYSYEVFVKDTNARFNKISLAAGGEIFNPSIVANPGNFTPIIQKDSITNTLTWQTACSDIRNTPYLAQVIAADDACGSPAKDTLFFEITVIEKPNSIPVFIASSNIVDTTIYAGTELAFNIQSQDPDTTDMITIDSVYTDIPANMIQPEIQRAQGLKTVSTILSWNTDCSNIGGPYTIRIRAWDDACRVVADSSEIVYRVTIIPNPSFTPTINLPDDTLITLIAGEQFHFEIQSGNEDEKANDNIIISSTGEIFGNIPGEFAQLIQKQNNGIALADLKWLTSCDQIRKEPYKIKVLVNNPICLTSDTIDMSFSVIPNTDIAQELPNVFTPNNDNINDLFSIKNQYKVYCDPEFTFRIFNRWGKKVFETRDPQFEWTGENLSDGTYFYSITSRARTQTGTLSLLR